jgi:site-specific DNA-cytosine methylase
MIGSLFSGIGGLELGLERAGLGPVAWQAECDPFCL